MERITGTLLAALVVCGLLAPGAASAATVADGSVTGATDGDTASLVDASPPDQDGDDDTNTTDTTDSTTDTTDSTDSTTDTVENTTDSTTDPDDDSDTTNTSDTTDSTTDTVENTTDSTTDAVENTTGSTTDTVENTTDSTTDTVDETGDTVENTTDSTTDGVENTTDSTVDDVEETADSTTDAVDETTDSTTDTVENTTDDGSLDVELAEDALPDDGPADANPTAEVDGDASLGVDASLDGAASLDGDSDVGDASPGDADGQAALDGAGTDDVDDATDEDDPAVAAFTPLGTRPLPGDVPVGSGTAALGGALALGAGYAGRRALAVGAGPAPGTTLAQARLTASVFADAVRARELPDWVRWLPVVGGYSRYDGTDPLAHEKRATIVEHLEASPGTYLSALAEETDIALPTVRYHVKILAHEDRVESEVIRGKRRYFPSGFEAAELAAALDDEATRDVLHALEVEEQASVSRLAEVLEKDPSTVTHHCKRLQEDGLVERERDGRAKVTSLTPDVREALRTVPQAGASESPAPADD